VILIVDDEKTIRQLVASILKRAGYDVVAVSSAREALEVMSGHTPELLLTDIVMPEMSGLALAATAHHLHYGVPVMFMSGFASNYEEELSGSVCLRKPFTPGQLLTAVQDVLALRKSSGGAA